MSPLTSCSSVSKKTFEPSLEAPAKHERCGARRGCDQPQTEHGRDRQEPGGRIAPGRPRTKLMSRHKPSLLTGCSALPLGPSTPTLPTQPGAVNVPPKAVWQRYDERTPGQPGQALTGTRAVLVPVSAHIRAHRRTSAHIQCAERRPSVPGDHRFTRERSLVRNQPRPCVKYSLLPDRGGCPTTC